ncbi:MAG TPA: nitroreductase/quinone reductase family protein [Candidatus Limnocylindrales bacterium]|nr:nitroreductase/quinone reductase family protein [Candidatus Limnocylindrales bacterium]
MDERLVRALARGHTIDITTTGRKTGLARRIEMVFHNIEGRIYISGMPRADRKRSWLYNLEADPRMTFHLKGVVTADVAAHARVIDDDSERRAIMPTIAANWGRTDIEFMVHWSPLIEVIFDDMAA